MTFPRLRDAECRPSPPQFASLSACLHACSLPDASQRVSPTTTTLTMAKLALVLAFGLLALASVQVGRSRQGMPKEGAFQWAPVNIVRMCPIDQRHP